MLTKTNNKEVCHPSKPFPFINYEILHILFPRKAVVDYHPLLKKINEKRERKFSWPPAGKNTVHLHGENILVFLYEFKTI